MQLSQIAEALSVVLEIKDDDTKATASYHLGAFGDMDINVYPDTDDLDHFFAFTAYPALSDYKMSEHIWHLEDDEEDHRIVSQQKYQSFDELIQAVREVNCEQNDIQAHRRRFRLSCASTVQTV